MTKSIKYGLLTVWFLTWLFLGNLVAYKVAHRNDEYKIIRGARVVETDDYLLAGKKPVSNIWEKISNSRNPAIALYILTVMKDPEFIDIFTKESGLNPNAKNWNCMYEGISTFCKPEDRDLAWSVDCGIAQLNFSGKECPKESFDPIWNIDRAGEKFERQGKSAWVVTW